MRKKKGLYTSIPFSILIYMKTRLFEWLVRRHCEKNLERVLHKTSNGVIYSPIDGEPIRERQENEMYKGVLIIANGDTLVSRLIKSGLANPEDVDSFNPVRGRDDFFELLNRQEGCDGAFIYDGINDQMTRVYELKHSTNDKIKLVEMLPKDFVQYNGNMVNVRDLGLKTRLAATLPPEYIIDAYQIKRTAYTDFGMGKVTHFDRDGLKEEFFLAYDPQSKGPFIDEEQKIVGKYRRYEREDGRLKRVMDRIVKLVQEEETLQIQERSYVPQLAHK
jgi:hypothetical protein